MLLCAAFSWSVSGFQSSGPPGHSLVMALAAFLVIHLVAGDREEALADRVFLVQLIPGNIGRVPEVLLGLLVELGQPRCVDAPLDWIDVGLRHCGAGMKPSAGTTRSGTDTTKLG